MSAASHATRHVAADERQRLVRAEHAREQAGLGQDLEAVADPEHRARPRVRSRRPPASRARSGRSRRSGGSRRTRTRRGGRLLRSPQGARAPCARSAARRRRGARARAGRRGRRSSRGRRRRRSAGAATVLTAAVELDLVALDQRVREQLLAHPLDLRARLGRVVGRRARARRAGRRGPRRRRSRDGAGGSTRPVPAGRGCPPWAGRARSPSREHHAGVGEVVRRTRSRSAARTPRRSGRACPRRRRPAAPGRARSCPSRATRSSRGRTACRTTAAAPPGAYSSAGQKRDESGVNASSASTSRPSSSTPNSSFVSARMIPRAARVLGGEAVELEREPLDLVEALLADERDGRGAVDVLVVAGLSPSSPA